MKIKLLTILMTGILFLTPTISSSDIFEKYCNVHWDGLRWKEGKKYFGDWKKLKIGYHGAKVATFYIPPKVYNHFNCSDEDYNNPNTECGAWLQGGYEVLVRTCKKSIY